MLTNADRADLVSLCASVVFGAQRRGGAGVGEQVRYGMKYREQVRSWVMAWLDANEPDGAETPAEALSVACAESVSGADALPRVRELLGEKSKRQNTIESELSLPEGALDGLLTVENGFSVNQQGWVSVGGDK